jgi:hypothetical protein
VRRPLRSVLALLWTVAALLVAGCATPSGSWCAIAKPLRLSEATVERMTDAEVEDALAHNSKGERLCGWQP